ncbi:MAG: glycine cleavage system protein H [Candidatus Heimdallarchaeota archaeon]|nr:glycine cleavage system protein H [Candidatus Heimdallarchaeota archaeon]
MINIEQYIFPDNLMYMTGEPGHIWIMKISETIVKIGADDYVSKRAGVIEYVRTMKVGKKVKKNQVIGTYESGKWIGQIKSPFEGVIVEKNEKLKAQPDLLNSDPYGEGWIVSLKIQNYETEIKEHDNIVSVGEELEKYIRWRISQE